MLRPRGGQLLYHVGMNNPKPKLTLLQILQSTMAGAIGVQSSRNRERDFSAGNIWVYIAAGIIFTALFIFTVMTVVKLVLGAD